MPRPPRHSLCWTHRDRGKPAALQGGRSGRRLRGRRIRCLWIGGRRRGCGLSGDGTLGLTLLDITDHWVFNYSLLIVGFLEVLMMGWVFGAGNLRAALNENARMKLGRWFEVLIRYILPAVLLVVIVTSLMQEWPLYGSGYEMPGYSWLTIFIPFFWLAFTLAFAFFITRSKTREI